MTIKPIPMETKKQMQRTLVKYSDMTDEMTSEILDIVIGAVDKYSTSDDPDLESASRLLKDTLDKQYGPLWHCAMGKGFSFDITAQVSISHLYLIF